MKTKYTIPQLGFCFYFISVLTNYCSGSSNFRGGTKSYGMHVEVSSLGTNLRYDLPASKVKASPSNDWKVTNNDAMLSSFLTPLFMTLSESHPKFDMKGTWPAYKMKLKVEDNKTPGKRIQIKRKYKKFKQTTENSGNILSNSDSLKRKHIQI